MAETFISKITPNSGGTYSLKLSHNLKVGSKSFNGTGDVEITAGDLGLSQALKFVGSTSTDLTDGSTTKPTVNSATLTPTTGDVVLGPKGTEFLWTGSAWELLGSDSSFALSSVKISAGTGLTGGGDLTQNRTLSIAYSTSSPKMDGAAAVGTSSSPARSDHVHPSDTSKLSLSGGTMTGTLTTKDLNVDGRTLLDSNTYGTTLPTTNLTTGRIFFKTLS